MKDLSSNKRAESGNWLPRDIGRSSQFPNGHVVVQFGDTFDHNENGKYLGIRDNTCAIIVDTHNPTLSKYTLDANNRIPEFIKQQAGEFPKYTRNKFWSFSGIVETGTDERGIIHGYTWFKITRMAVLDVDRIQEYYVQMGVAKVEYNPATRQIKALRTDLEQKTWKNFKFPCFGYTCALRVDSHVYLYGQTFDGRKDIVLARVPLAQAESIQLYEFWTGSGWSKDVHECQPVMQRIEHGQIFRTTMFGECSEFRYCFLGCSSNGDSHVLMARAKNPEGPWEDGWVLNMDTYKSDPKNLSRMFNYCMYPHPWAMGFNTKFGLGRTGDLMVTWSEGDTKGSVLAASIRFEMEERRFEDLSSDTSARQGGRRWDHGPPGPN